MAGRLKYSDGLFCIKTGYLKNGQIMIDLPLIISLSDQSL